MRFDGFWAPMDTLKERAALEEMHRSGNRPWALWEHVVGERIRGSPACADLAGANRFVRCCVISRTRRICDSAPQN